MAAPEDGRPGGLEERDAQSSYRPPSQPHPYHPTSRARSPPQAQQQFAQQERQKSPLQQYRQQRSFAPQSPPLQTQNLPQQRGPPRGDQRFSWTETPAHVQPRPVYTIQSATTIDESPASSLPQQVLRHQVAPQREQAQEQAQQDQQGQPGDQNQRGQSHNELPPLPQMPTTPPPPLTATYSLYPRDKPSPERNGAPQPSPSPPAAQPRQEEQDEEEAAAAEAQAARHNAPRPGDVHPAHFAPFDEPRPSSQARSPPPRQQHRRTRTGSNGVPLQILTSTTPPQDHKPFPHLPPPIPQDDTKRGYPGASSSSSSPATPTISTPRLAPRTPTYDPSSLTGPNVSVETSHRPGQITHPNASQDPHWQSGLCAGDSLCFEALFCPCAVYGRTQYRIAQKKARREPTDVLGHDWCNGSCMLMGAACGLQWLLALVQRAQVRNLYKMHADGGGGGFFKACCCCCCVLAQNEREIKARETSLRRNAGPATGAVPYASPEGGMVYAPPPR